VRRVVITGAGLAGFRTARALRDGGFTGRVTVVGDERHHPYDRPPLSKQLLAGTVSSAGCRLPGAVDDIEWQLESAAVRLIVDDARVQLSDGSAMAFDDLVVATGRRARPWPGPSPKRGVHTLRTIDDVVAIRAATSPGARVVIIGSGFVGCEAASTLSVQGVDVVVTSIDPYPMPVMGPHVGATTRELHAEHGVRWRLGVSVDAIEGHATPSGVRLSTGEVLDADVVLVAIGSLPNSEWLADTELDLTGGVVHVDDTCRALDGHGQVVANTWAAGDVAAWRHRDGSDSASIEHWSNARDMADNVAANIIGRSKDIKLTSVPAFWSDQYDVKIKSVGYLRGADELVTVDERPERRALLVEARRSGVVIGAIGLNMNRAVLDYQRELRSAALYATPDENRR
jgi:NADPH-dependent 2,4-dienoyl-CoA reductase/sulfur reductase-like enzyme